LVLVLFVSLPNDPEGSFYFLRRREEKREEKGGEGRRREEKGEERGDPNIFCSNIFLRDLEGGKNLERLTPGSRARAGNPPQIFLAVRESGLLFPSIFPGSPIVYVGLSTRGVGFGAKGNTSFPIRSTGRKTS
jgi:hypothetical protein